jgi:hypothetical protein
MFFVSVASKGFNHAVSLLFATLARRSISVVSKGLTLHKICAISDHFWVRNGGGGEDAEATRDVPER